MAGLELSSIRTVLLFIISPETQNRYDGHNLLHPFFHLLGGTYEIADALIGFPSELKNPFSASLTEAASHPPLPIFLSERREKRRMKSEVLSQMKRGPVPDMVTMKLRVGVVLVTGKVRLRWWLKGGGEGGLLCLLLCYVEVAVVVLVNGCGGR